MSDFDVILALLDKQGRTARDNNNSGRLAFSMHTVETKGLGQIRHAAIPFEVIFTQEPIVVSGSSVGKVKGDVDPMAMSCVRSWVRNDNGYYIGFIPVFRIDLYLTAGQSEALATVDLANSCTMVHNFLFAGQAYKDLGDAIRQQANSTPVKEVEF